MSTKVEQWIACDLRYVAETKLSRLTEDELARLYFGLGKKHSLSITSVSADRSVMIEKLMQMKKEIQVAYGIAAVQRPRRSRRPRRPRRSRRSLNGAAGRTRGRTRGKTSEAEAEAPIELTEEELAAKRDREERAAAFIQLAAAVRRGPPEPPEEAADGCRLARRVPVRQSRSTTHHRLRVCSFNACKMRLGSANKAYVEASESRRQGRVRGHAQGRRAGAEVAHARGEHGRL